MSTRPGGLYNEREGTKPIDAPQTLVGRVLEGRFRLDRLLSTGGMGVIFEATQLSVGRQVAVKLLKPTLSDEFDLMRRFTQEVEVVANLAHSNIVSLIDAGQDAGGLTYLAMEFIQGETFRQALQAGRLTLVELLEIFVQVCEALIEAHAHGIIHRDLKFDNVMLQRRHDGRLHVQILDFGVAKLLGRDVNLTRGGQIPGTPGIIAPELVAEQPASPRSDLYSLGVLLYTTLTGQAPFSGHNDLELMRAHQFDPVPRIDAQIQPYVPVPLIELVYELMAKAPEQRPEDAMAVRDRLETIRSRLRADFSDLPPYIPPAFEQDGDVHGSGAFRVVSPRQRDTPPELRQIAPSGDSGEGDAEVGEGRDDDRLVVVPTSVVTMLALVLLVLILMIVYLIRQTLVM